MRVKNYRLLYLSGEPSTLLKIDVIYTNKDYFVMIFCTRIKDSDNLKRSFLSRIKYLR